MGAGPSWQGNDCVDPCCRRKPGEDDETGSPVVEGFPAHNHDKEQPQQKRNEGSDAIALPMSLQVSNIDGKHGIQTLAVPVAVAYSGASPTSSRSSAASVARLTPSQRHTKRRYSEVDMAMVRGISLRKSLGRLGRVWRYNPSTWLPEDRLALYNLSAPARSFNVFLSHTWWTPGRWKFLSLSFQYGWCYVLALWILTVALTASLCLEDVLPMPMKYEARIMGFTDVCPMGICVLCSSLLATVLGLLSTPYWPRCFSFADTGFIDVTCINQVDKRLMERGVFSIAGFLGLAEELRILWSAPYLSRLWCVFELAAYKKVNPSGKVAFRPLFLERVVALTMVAQYGVCLLLLVARDVFGPGVVTFVASFAIWILPNSMCVYGLRMSFREKYQLLLQLESFDLDQVGCSQKFDRDFIHAAITKWYGHKDIFASYVRRDLKQEFAKTLSATRLPNRYLLLMLTPILSMSFEFFLANWKGGAPVEVLISYFVGMFLAFDVFCTISAILLMIYLCDLLAPKRFGPFDHMQTLAIIIVVTGLQSLAHEVAAMSYQSSLEGAFGILALAVILAAFMWWLEGTSIANLVGKLRRQPDNKSDVTDAEAAEAAESESPMEDQELPDI
ncbi:GIP [Symbiodinium microadriaticum]|nr:GIP [Symbiodinium sp. KB8]CAE7849524.1 GIP [Symbiodinium microadriaticum]